MAINTGGAVSTLLIDDHASCVSASALLAQQDCCGTITAAANGELGYNVGLARFITPLRSIVDDDAPRPCADRDLGGDGIALGVDDRHLVVGSVGGIEAGAVA